MACLGAILRRSGRIGLIYAAASAAFESFKDLQVKASPVNVAAC